MDAIVSDSAALTALIEATTKTAISAGLPINNFILPSTALSPFVHIRTENGPPPLAKEWR
jgi:hypothetical protein